MEKGKIHSFADIKDWAGKNDYEIIEHGNGLIGASFIALVNDDSYTVSFVATNYDDTIGYFYECIYSDI